PFEKLLRSLLPADCVVVDSAATTALAVRRLLQNLPAETTGSPSLGLLATDGLERFARVGSRFLGESLQPEAIERVDLT
ncbi:MAG: glutamate racemase, partial [Steroidobacteraceae bacterium]